MDSYCLAFLSQLVHGRNALLGATSLLAPGKAVLCSLQAELTSFIRPHNMDRDNITRVLLRQLSTAGTFRCQHYLILSYCWFQIRITLILPQLFLVFSDQTQHYIAQQCRHNCLCLQFCPWQLPHDCFALFITETQTILKTEQHRISIKQVNFTVHCVRCSPLCSFHPVLCFVKLKMLPYLPHSAYQPSYSLQTQLMFKEFLLYSD